MLRSILGDEVRGNGGLDVLGTQVCFRDTITILEDQSRRNIIWSKTLS